MQVELPASRYAFVALYDAIRCDEEVRCDFCNRRLRWVHLLQHDALDRDVSVGCCCARRLCADYDPDEAEADAKNRAARLRTFLDPSKWRPSKASGNPTRFVGPIMKGGRRTLLTVFPSRFGQWSFIVKRPGREAIRGNSWHPTEADAKLAAFERWDDDRED